MFEPRVRGTLCSNPGFGNSMVELWVRELYDRTRGLETKPKPGARTLGSGTLWSNLGFEELYVRTLGWGTVCSSPEFGELYVGTRGFTGLGFGLQGFRVPGTQGSNIELMNSGSG